MNFAWPQAEIAVMGAAGATEILYAKDIARADAPNERARELTEQYTADICNTRIAAARGFIDAVIAPRDTRASIVQALDALAGKREQQPARQHGNEPL
jgi:propionyl-CoA carboxylase beta chain